MKAKKEVVPIDMDGNCKLVVGEDLSERALRPVRDSAPRSPMKCPWVLSVSSFANAF